MPRWKASVPASDPSTPPTMRKSVDFPEPLTPMNPTSSPPSPAPGRRSVPRPHREEAGRLPRAVDADEPHLLAFVHGERHAVEDHAGTVGLVEILDIEDVHGSIGFRSALAGIVGGEDTPDRAGSARGGS